MNSMDALIRECNRIGVEIRPDSQLATNFANGILEEFWTAEDVAYEMKGTQYLYANTGYKSYLENACRTIANDMHENYPLVDWKLVWQAVRHYGIPALKLAYIRNVCPDYPVLS